MKGASAVTVFLTGSILFVVGAAKLWDGAGFAMALGFVLLLTIRGRFSPQIPNQTVIERRKRDNQIAEAVNVGDRSELQSFIEPPSQWEPVEMIAILPQARAGYVRVQVRHADGTESAQSLDQLWHAHRLNQMWRPLTS